MTTVRVLAPAKINLGLEVLRKRDDGYHDIATIMQTVSIFDRLTLTPAPDLRVHASDPSLAEEDNLVLRAATLYGRELGTPDGASIVLSKRIPAAAGLGGASSDAAATLVALSPLWRRTPDARTIAKLAERLGSDVPFLLGGGTALIEGRGEMRTSLRPLAGVWFVVAVPPMSIARKTATLYAALTPDDFTSGNAARELAALLASRRLPRPALLANAFRRPLLTLRPELAEYEGLLTAAGAPFVALSGSGPTLYTVVDDLRRARAIAGRACDSLSGGTRVFVCRPVHRAPLIRIDEP